MTFFKYLTALFVSLGLFSCGCNRQEASEQSKGDVLRVAVEEGPSSLDPRQARTLIDTTSIHMLYEGLMHINKKGKLENALAEKITVSPDLLTYEIHLKPSSWSDGSPVTASDFVEAWKSQLDPQFPSPNAAQLYVIKGAKKAKAGTIALDDIGLKILNDTSFLITLEHQTAYFPNLLASHFYLPVHVTTRRDKRKSSHLISNGPFVLNAWKPHNEISFVKNASYHRSSDVSLTEVVFIVSEASTALHLFDKDQLDWIGSPLSTLPQDAIDALRKQRKVSTKPGDGTYWFRFNTDKEPFTSIEMRKAFNLALHRRELILHILQGAQQPALSLLPPSLSLNPKGYFADNQVVSAWELFQKALIKTKVSKDELPTISLCYTEGERNHKIAQAVQQQWEKAFNIPIQLQSCEGKFAYDKLAKGDYQIMLGSWFADIADPINFLGVFKYKNNGTNNTRWENPAYITLLDASNQEADVKKRKDLLMRAEFILMEEAPVAPLFFNAFDFIKKEHVGGVYFSSLGYLDFRDAFINEAIKELENE